MNAVLAYVSDSDSRVFGRLQGWTPPRWFRAWMILATRAADGWIYGALAPALALQGGRGQRVLAAGCTAAGLANLLLVVVKRRVRRPRPCELAPHLRFAVQPPDRWSFPSGHTLNAFAVGTVVALAFPVSAPLVLLLSVSVAISRVVLGMHFVSDVVAGSLLGGLVGAGAFRWLC
jgi:undecaprenyl-diphosphatase